MTTKTWPLRPAVNWRALLSSGVAALAVLAVIGGVLWLETAPPEEPDVKEALADALNRAPSSPRADDTARAADFAAYLQRHPKDARALVLKARLDVQAERFAEAIIGYERAIAASPKVARDAGVWVELAEAKGLLQGGQLLGAPAELVEKALILDSTHPRALDLAGSLAWERNDFAAAVRHWSRLLAQIPESDPRHSELYAAIEAAGRRARLALPPATSSSATSSATSNPSPNPSAPPLSAAPTPGPAPSSR